MHPIAYLVNRYPEATLTAVRREIEAVSAAGVKVFRFAHRPSVQPLASELDRCEADLTEYLVHAGFVLLLAGIVSSIATRPLRFLRALRAALALAPSPTRAAAYVALACHLRARLAALRVSVLHVHFGLSSAVVGLLTRMLGGPRWCLTIHGPEEFLPGNRSRLRTFAASADAIVTISDWASAAVEEAARPIVVTPRVVRMGVGTTFLVPPAPIGGDASIVCIARLDPRKGHAVLLEALSRSETARRFRVEFVGDGPLRSALEADIHERGLDGSVALRGWLGEEEVKEALDRCRFLVLPSLDEGLPVAIMESFARARPVLATQVAGVLELITPGVTGLVVPPNDAASLSQGLEHLASLPADQLYRLGLNGRNVVLEKHDTARNVRSLIEIWRKVADA